MRVERVGPSLAESIRKFNDFRKAELELEFIRSQKIHLLLPEDPGYPPLLRHTPDLPSIVFCSGSVPDPTARYVAIVGTRKSSPRAEAHIRALIRCLQPYNCVIVSGLAYGIDYLAHRIALQEQVPTIAVLANGLKRIYPEKHVGLTKEIVRSGGSLLTEHFSNAGPEKVHFPRRNRIVAGLCSAVIVIESGINGGSLITADLAFQYDREVFAYPGRIGDEWSSGCLKLIRENKAQIVTDPCDIPNAMNWPQAGETPSQLQLTFDLPPEQEQIWKLLREQSPLHLDELRALLEWNAAQLSLAILEMEMNGVIKLIPGNSICLSH